MAENRSRGPGFDRTDGWLGGICAGIGRFFGFDPIFVRIAAIVLAVFFPKLSIASYLIAWLLLHRREQMRR